MDEGEYEQREHVTERSTKRRLRDIKKFAGF